MKLTLIAGALLLAAPALAQPGMEAPNNLYRSEGVLPPAVHRTIPSPGTEQALRHQIESLEAGQLDYHAMSPNVADPLRFQIEKIQPPLVRQWGALLSLKFRDVTAQGLDVYEARFEHAQVRWKIAPLSGGGKITLIDFKTLT